MSRLEGPLVVSHFVNDVVPSKNSLTTKASKGSKASLSSRFLPSLLTHTIWALKPLFFSVSSRCRARSEGEAFRSHS